jgi:hypothetical protein
VNASGPPEQTGHFTTGFGPFTTYPHTEQIAVTAASSARSFATARSSARICIFSAMRPGMKIAMASSITLEVMTVCPCSIA